MGTKICKVCGRELPLSEFKLSRTGNPQNVCRECCNAKLRETKANKHQMGGGKLPPFSDPDFDGKDPGEVVRMMGRAQRWLESRGYTIRLEGEYTKTTVYKLKF